jgi:phosphonate metabolism protein PhnN/1,5-bisphosphokinase (PRPP-forming)
MTRYALYYTPPAGSEWNNVGARWLGRDAASGALLAQPQVPGMTREAFRKLTARPRRYGFHATLKAPFRLAQGFSETDLLRMVRAFAARQRPVPVGTLRPEKLRNFLALRPEGDTPELNALALRCVEYFDLLRASPSAHELEKQRAAGLTPRQDTLLKQWGYPYAEEAFQFHLTVTDTLHQVDDDVVCSVYAAASEWFGSVSEPSPDVDGLSVMREPEPEAPFEIVERIPFGQTALPSTMPGSGRLFYLVGASGAGKDALLKWVRQRLSRESDIVVAQRTITRPADRTDEHEPMDPATFEQCAAQGCFSLVWRANGLAYGVRRSMEAELRAGRDIVVNGSREFVPTLKQRFPDASIIWVDVDPSILRSRLEARGRESGDALLRRLERATQFTPPNTNHVERIDNNGSIEQAGRRFMQLLRRRFA